MANNATATIVNGHLIHHSVVLDLYMVHARDDRSFEVFATRAEAVARAEA